METKHKKALYQAMISRDPRNDGRFYIGVKTTGIYCRPICPAKPKFENVEFYRSKAEAEGAGFRPCLRCRPDISPLSVRWQGTAGIMNRALKILEIVDQSGGDLVEVADRLGMTDRHLRRLFQEHLGATPIEIAISQRLHLARQLLLESELSILDIALASGFGSQRRFHDAFQKTYKTSPTEYRKEAKLKVEGRKGSLFLKLPYTLPYDWDNLIAFFKRHQALHIEVIEANFYQRHFKTIHGRGFYTIRNNTKHSCLEVELSLPALEDFRSVVERIKSQFDLGHNPFHLNLSDFETRAEWEEILQETLSMRIPGAFDSFETSISIILSQLVSTERARELLNSVIQKFGEKTEASFHQDLTHFFPSPEVLMHADFQGIGITRVRAEAIKNLSRAVFEGQIDLSPSADLLKTRKHLLALKGIGPWTTEAIAMRCLSDADAFPAKDLIIARALEKFGMSLEFLSPWRAYFALAIWKTQAHLLTKKRGK